MHAGDVISGGIAVAIQQGNEIVTGQRIAWTRREVGDGASQMGRRGGKQRRSTTKRDFGEDVKETRGRAARCEGRHVQDTRRAVEVFLNLSQRRLIRIQGHGYWPVGTVPGQGQRDHFRAHLVQAADVGVARLAGGTDCGCHRKLTFKRDGFGMEIREFQLELERSEWEGIGLQRLA